MNLKTLNQQLQKTIKSVDDVFHTSKEEAEELVYKNSDLDDTIEKLSTEENQKTQKNIDKKAKETELKDKKIEDEKAKSDALKDRVEKQINSKKKTKKVDFDTEDKDTLKTKTTESANREIVQLFNAMIQRKEFVNRVRTVEVELKKDSRNSIMVVDGIPFMSLNVDGNGSLVLRLEKSDNSRKVFSYIIIPLLNVLNTFFENSEITISNKKDATKNLSLNSEKTIYVSTNQIKNKPIKSGQMIIFTNLKHGKFHVK